ncbi:MAG: hypothetical protein R3C26_13480 [Calditrichia bacterium]
MPDFHLQPDEALALTLFLSEQQFLYRRAPVKFPRRSKNGKIRLSRFRKLIKNSQRIRLFELHSFNGAGEQISVRFGNYRLPTSRNLCNNIRIAGGFWHCGNGDATQFFAPENAFEPRYPDAANRVQNLTAFLMETGAAQRNKMEQVFTAAKENFRRQRLRSAKLFSGHNSALVAITIRKFLQQICNWRRI